MLCGHLLNKTYLRLMVTLCVTLFSFAASAGIQPLLKVGTEGAYYPFNYMDEKGEVQGFDVELSKAICAELKMECQFVTQEWNGIITGLLAKRYDVIVAGMSATEERKKQVDFTDTYFISPIYFVGRKGTDIKDLGTSLQGKTIGVQRGTVHAAFAEKNFLNAKIKQYDSQDAVNLDLKSKRLDLVLADSAVMSVWMEKAGAGKFVFVGPRIDVGPNAQFFGEGSNIALRKGDEALKKRINQALIAIKANGTYDRIKAQFFKVALPQ
jgi:lysine-arginine-ornithine-binding protein